MTPVQKAQACINLAAVRLRDKPLLTPGYLGSLHFVLRDFREATGLFSRRATLNEKLGDRVELAADLANRGNAWSKLANRNEAKKDWARAKALYEEAGKAKEAGIMAASMEA